VRGFARAAQIREGDSGRAEKARREKAAARTVGTPETVTMTKTIQGMYTHSATHAQHIRKPKRSPRSPFSPPRGGGKSSAPSGAPQEYQTKKLVVDVLDTFHSSAQSRL